MAEACKTMKIDRGLCVLTERSWMALHERLLQVYGQATVGVAAAAATAGRWQRQSGRRKWWDRTSWQNVEWPFHWINGWRLPTPVRRSHNKWILIHTVHRWGKCNGSCWSASCLFQSLYSLPSTNADRCIKRGQENGHHRFFAPMRKTGGDGLLSQIFMWDKNRVHHFDPILKLQFTKWQPNDMPSKKIFKCVSLVGKKFCSLVFLLNRDYNEMWQLSWSINWSPSSSSSHKKNISIVGLLQV